MFLAALIFILPQKLDALLKLQKVFITNGTMNYIRIFVNVLK